MFLLFGIPVLVAEPGMKPRDGRPASCRVGLDMGDGGKVEETGLYQAPGFEPASGRWMEAPGLLASRAIKAASAASF